MQIQTKIVKIQLIINLHSLTKHILTRQPSIKLIIATIGEFSGNAFLKRILRSILFSFRTSIHQDTQSVPTSVPQQQQQQPQHTKSQLETSSTSSFRLIDDSNRSNESMQMCTPPKQSSKPTSIFSPEWDGTESGPVVTLPPKRPPSNSSSIFNAKPKTDSPKKEKHRSETPHKKDKRSGEQPTTPNSQKQRPPSTIDSKKVKIQPTQQSTLPQQSIIDIKPPIQSQKRTFSFTQDQIKQDDGVDFREQKVRKVEPDLFGQDLENIFDVRPPKQLPPQLFNTSSNSNSQFDPFDAFNSIKDSKPVIKTFSGSLMVNGIETNPDYVKSLLQQSLSSNDMKFTSSLNPMNSSSTVNPTNTIGQMNSLTGISSAKKLHDTSSGYVSLGSITSEPPETILESTIQPLETVITTEEGDHSHRNKSKKKKDKHKHKDRSKDKEERSKDKEERKKHKKDKERKEREKEDTGLKIIFSKGDTEATGPFKIKIPKESIRGDLGAPQTSESTPSSFKIKISKDKVENYGNKFFNNNNDAAGVAAPNVGVNAPGPLVAPVHKKKEREKDRKDRDRSKGKHNNNNVPELNKSNGGGAVTSQMNPTSNLTNQRSMQTGSGTQQQIMGLPSQQTMLSSSLPNPNKVSASDVKYYRQLIMRDSDGQMIMREIVEPFECSTANVCFHVERPVLGI